jgi:hypothetical protein
VGDQKYMRFIFVLSLKKSGRKLNACMADWLIDELMIMMCQHLILQTQ